ncbi:MAG: signal peptide peptidase SppA [Pseudomonadota bacterium]
MSADNSNFTVWGFIKGFGKLMIGVLLLLQGIIGLVVMLLFVGVLVGVTNGVAGNNDKVSVSIPDGVPLYLNPNGVLVEQAEVTDPFQLIVEEAYGIDQPGQIEVHDIVRVLRKAKDDKRITGIVLDLDALAIPSSSASKAHYIARELDKFKESGKSVIAVSDFYGQEQYLIAANADEIYVNDFGGVFLPGYGRYKIYYKSLLEKLKITTHIFRVGTFKSAVEPLLRDDMSEEAKEANLTYLNVLWEQFIAGVENARGLNAGSIEAYANNFNDALRAADGDFAEAALAAGLVDGLKSRAEQQAMLIEKFGDDEEKESFKRVEYRRYLSSLDGEKDTSAKNVGIVTAAGVIVDGEASQGEAAGGDSVAKLLKKARLDDDVQAVVLRVDSPGGSAFASEVIRDEVLAIKKAGKPVVVSMGSLAASGGYWISANADEIWAAPTTITGSIGIFGYVSTLENAAAEIGVYTDGVGTTDFSPLLAAGLGPLPENAADVFQQSIERGYDRFLTIVGEGRDLEIPYVDSVAQGRVWIGGAAQERRLVDKLGGYDDAIASAAALAGLEEYDAIEIDESVRTPFDFILSNMAVKFVNAAGFDKPRNTSFVRKLIAEAEEHVSFFADFNDPNATYARCLTCE